MSDTEKTPLLSAPPERIVFIGPMAAGKTSIGRRVAALLEMEFVDTDREFEKKHGTISDVFTSLGENWFREREARIIERMLEKKGIVLSLGGGAVLDPGTQQLLGSECVVYLETDAATVEPFITRDTRRPLLAEDPLAAWSEVFERRRTTYERLATVTVDVTLSTDRNPDATARRVCRAIESVS